MMIGKLKKLEAADGAQIRAVPPGETPASPSPTRKTTPSAELQMLSVPSDGWLSGPGRRFNSA